MEILYRSPSPISFLSRKSRVTRAAVCSLLGLLFLEIAPLGNALPPTASEANSQKLLQAAVVNELLDQSAKRYDFSRASLSEVIRLLADDAGISFISMPGSPADEDVLITLSLNAAPFQALQAISKIHGIALVYENGIWYLNSSNDKDLIARTYRVKYNPQEMVDISSSSLDGTNSSKDVAASGGDNSSNSSENGANLSLQGATNIFIVQENPMVKEIKELLGIQTEGFVGRVDQEVTVDSFEPIESTKNLVRPSVKKAEGLASSITTALTGETPAAPNGAQVIWNSDANTLYVVATRQQHEWVEGYLASIDRPQNLIAIEVKFFETTKDPRKQLGMDWSGTMSEGVGATVTNLGADINLTSGTAVVPGTAVLSATDLDLRLRAFASDRDVSTVSYPRVLTLNNREVVIRSVVNQPVLGSSSSVTPGVGGTTTASVSYIPIGTIINILPKVLADNSMVLNVSITVSSIIGEEVIGGNAYPIASSRVYTAQLNVESNYTLAIGGLEEAIDSRIGNGIPGLRKIPGLGKLFQSSDKRRSKKNLLFFITPTMLDAKAGQGISETPRSVIPTTPQEPSVPAFTPSGNLVGGRAALEDAVSWAAHRYDFIYQTIEEHRDDHRTLQEIDRVSSVCEKLRLQMNSMSYGNRGERRSLAHQKDQIDWILSALPALKKQVNLVR